MTSIITTIGPASLQSSVLEFFASHGVKIARLNFSHGTAAWHTEAGHLCRSYGFDLMLDLAGPKVLLGSLTADSEITTGEEIIIEEQVATKEYPYEENINGKTMRVFPCQFPLYQYIEGAGATILINDGYLRLTAISKENERVVAKVDFGGVVKSNKGVNLPGTKLDIHFLVDRDLELLRDCLPALLPEWVAPSFVKSTEDLETLKAYILKLKEEFSLPADYMPKICTKLEMSEVVTDEELPKVIDASDMVMVARGDLALETTPAHIETPFLQEKIVALAHSKNKPVVVATQILESMISSPVPTRAEVSDLYRAIHINKAEFVMLSGETAAGKFPEKCVEVMYNMACHSEK